MERGDAGDHAALRRDVSVRGPGRRRIRRRGGTPHRRGLHPEHSRLHRGSGGGGLPAAASAVVVTEVLEEGLSDITRTKYSVSGDVDNLNVEVMQ
mgnify:CR=1 FL=1